MKPKKEDLNQLIDQYLKGTATEVEKVRLEGAYNNAVDAMHEHSDALPETDLEDVETWNQIRSACFQKIAKRIDERQPTQLKTFRISKKMVAAAASLVLAFTLLYIYQFKGQRVPSTEQISTASTELPGAYKATLSLSDGQQFELRADQEQIRVTSESAIHYKDGTPIISGTTAQFATINVPMGGHYNLLLPDGSTVYLNAGSKITYPITFAHNHRTVELEGEAYFEIAHNKDAPFVVQSKGQFVQVLGTEFSIRAYESEATRTTLISGKVAVGLLGANRESWQELKPGQQFHHEGAKTQILSVDVTQFTAWKDGWFIYHDRPLNEALKEIARWYVLDLPSENIPTVLVNAEIHRTTPLDQVLQAMNIATGLTIQLEERRIMIRP